MVRGNPHDSSEVPVFLDDLIKKTFMFVKDHPYEVMPSQPGFIHEACDISNNGFSRGLTDYLIREGIVSAGYKVVLSGHDLKNPPLYEGWHELVVYDTTEKNMRLSLKQKKNVELWITLKGADLRTMDHAYATYELPRSTVFFEGVTSVDGNKYAGHIFEKVLKDRLVSIDGKYDFVHSSDTLKGKDGAKLIGDNGALIPQNLFSDLTRERLASHPKGTVYKEIQYSQIACFFPL